jgi:hypothetical protein
MEMKTIQPTALDLLKEELCSQYDLKPEQLSFEIRIHAGDKEKSRQIALDFSKGKYNNNLNNDPENCFYGYGKIPGVWAWAYFNEEEADPNEE